MKYIKPTMKINFVVGAASLCVMRDCWGAPSTRQRFIQNELGLVIKDIEEDAARREAERGQAFEEDYRV